MGSGNQSIPCFLILCKERMAQVSAKSVVIEWLLGSTVNIKDKIGPVWKLIRTSFIVPVLRAALYICLVMSFLLFVEWVHVMFLAALAKLFRKKPVKRYKWEQIKDDLENGNVGFPMILVQVPIYNEVEVSLLLSWPSFHTHIRTGLCEKMILRS